MQRLMGRTFSAILGVNFALMEKGKNCNWIWAWKMLECTFQLEKHFPFELFQFGIAGFEVFPLGRGFLKNVLRATASDCSAECLLQLSTIEIQRCTEIRFENWGRYQRASFVCNCTWNEQIQLCTLTFRGFFSLLFAGVLIMHSLWWRDVIGFSWWEIKNGNVHFFC